MASAPVHCQYPPGPPPPANMMSGRGPYTHPSAKMPPYTKADVTQGKILRIALDYGTVTGMAAFHIAESGEQASMRNIHNLEVQPTKFNFPMVAGYHGNSLIWGFEMEAKLRSGEMAEESAIRLAKLALYECDQTAEIVNLMEEQLNVLGKEGVRFFADHLQAIDRAVMHSARTGIIGWTYDLDTIEREYHICVPVMWTPTSTKLFMDAVKLAGLPRTELVLESESAAALGIEEMRGFSDHLPCQIMRGDDMMVADLGGGTEDLAVYKFGDSAEIGAQVALRSVGAPEGELVGSEWINRLFLKWLETTCREIRRVGGIDAMCRSLSLTKPAFLARASAAFEAKKKDYPFNSTLIPIMGTGNAHCTILVSATRMRSFFDPLIDRIISLISRKMTIDTKVVYIPGGFGRSEYLLERLRAEFDPPDSSTTIRKIKIWQGVRCQGEAYDPICTGALLRHNNIAIRGIPARYAFGVAQVEQYDYRLHHNATIYRPGDIMANGQVCAEAQPNIDLVKYDPLIKAMDIVENRWVTLLAKGEVVDDETDFTKDLYQVQYLYPSEDEFSTTIYWTDQDIADHAPVFSDKRQQKLVEVHNFPLKKASTRAERDVYEVHWNLKLVCRGANVEVQWQILRDRLFDKDTGERNTRHATPADIVAEQKGVINDGKYNSFAHTRMID